MELIKKTKTEKVTEKVTEELVLEISEKEFDDVIKEIVRKQLDKDKKLSDNDPHFMLLQILNYTGFAARLKSRLFKRGEE